MPFCIPSDWVGDSNHFYDANIVTMSTLEAH